MNILNIKTSAGRTLRAAAYHLDPYLPGAFSYLSPGELKTSYISRSSGCPFKNHRVQGFEPEICKSFAHHAQGVQHEYLLHHGRECVIEPIYGWAVTDGKELIIDSIPYSKDRRLPKPCHESYTSSTRKTIEADAIISLRFAWGNYYHFFNDILGQLLLCDRHSVPRDIPIVIPKAATELSYFQDALERSEPFRKRSWLVQDDDVYVVAKEAYFCKNFPNVKWHFEAAVKMLDAPKADDSDNKHLFVTRSPSRERRISNSEEILQIAESFGLLVVDCDGMSLNQQIEIFSRARGVCGIHGAGLTNIIFRANSDCSLLEIFPSNEIKPNFLWLAREFGFYYDAICGENRMDGEFYLEPDKFKKKLSTFLGAGPMQDTALLTPFIFK